jgi:hypothetical protein
MNKAASSPSSPSSSSTTTTAAECTTPKEETTLTSSEVCLVLYHQLENIRKALTCPLCLSTFVDPVTLSQCCHAYCRGCLLHGWDEQERHVKHSRTTLKCPQCQGKTSRRSLVDASESLMPLIHAYKRVTQACGLAPLQYEPQLASHLTQQPLLDNHDTLDIVSIHQHVQVARTMHTAMVALPDGVRAPQALVVAASQRLLVTCAAAAHFTEQDDTPYLNDDVPTYSQLAADVQAQEASNACGDCSSTSGGGDDDDDETCYEPDERERQSVSPKTPVAFSTNHDWKQLRVLKVGGTDSTASSSSSSSTVDDGLLHRKRLGVEQGESEVFRHVSSITSATLASTSIHPDPADMSRSPVAHKVAAVEKEAVVAVHSCASVSHRNLRSPMVSARPLPPRRKRTAAIDSGDAAHVQSNNKSSPATSAVVTDTTCMAVLEVEIADLAQDKTLPTATNATGRVVSDLLAQETNTDAVNQETLPVLVHPRTHKEAGTHSRTVSNSCRRTSEHKSVDKDAPTSAVSSTLEARNGEMHNSSSNDPSSSHPWTVGTLVQVQERSWPGMNKRGGVAHVTAVHPGGSCDVLFILGGKEKQVDAQYLRLYCDNEQGRRNSTTNLLLRRKQQSTRMQRTQHPDRVPRGLLQKLEEEEGLGTPGTMTSPTTAATTTSSSTWTSFPIKGRPRSSRKVGPLPVNAPDPPSKKRGITDCVTDCLSHLLPREKKKAKRDTFESCSVEELCATADVLYQHRFQQAFRSHIVHVVASNLSEIDRRKLKELCKPRDGKGMYCVYGSMCQVVVYMLFIQVADDLIFDWYSSSARIRTHRPSCCHVYIAGRLSE